MPSMSAVIAALGLLGQAAALSIATLPTYGVQNSFDAMSLNGTDTALPDKLSRAQLPCLLILPEVGLDQGYEPLSFVGGSPKFTFQLTQLYLGVEASQLGVSSALPYQITFIDAFNAYVKANPLLTVDASPIYQVPLCYTVDPGVIEYAEIEYHAVTFKHTFTIYL